MTRAPRAWLIAASCVILAACGGSASTPPITPDPEIPPGTVVGNAAAFPGPGSSPWAQPGEGIWQGEITSDVSGETRDAVALADGWGMMRLLLDKGHVAGLIDRRDVSNELAEFSIQATGTAFAGLTWRDGSRVATFTLTGTISPPTVINGYYTGGSDTGTFSLSFDPASDRRLDLERLDGMWAVRDLNQNIVATFEIASGGVTGGLPSASIDGSDQYGCVYTGTIRADVWLLSAYLFDVSLMISNCPWGFRVPRNGDYEGPAGLTDLESGSNMDDLFIVAVEGGGGHVLTLELERI